MAAHATSPARHDEPVLLEPARTNKLFLAGLVLAAAGIVLAVLLALPFGGLRRFFLSYLVGYMFALSLHLGALFFVMLQHVTRSGWSVNVRRVPEAMCKNLWVFVPLSLPILLSLLMPGTDGHPTMYPWAAHRHHDEAAAEVERPGPVPSGDPVVTRGPDAARAFVVPEVDLLTEETMTVAQARHHLHIDELTEGKFAWLNRPFFALRVILYLAVLALLGSYFHGRSVQQDRSGDPGLTTLMQKWAPLGLLAYAAVVTGLSFDLVMSVDPHFFSTIFGGYIFAGSVVGFFAFVILAYQFLRLNGLLGVAVSTEHYHDLGKFLFAFVFFWGYIAFSQFMLIWYANIPETTYWFAVRGATTVAGNHGFGAWSDDPAGAANVGWWTVISMTLLVGHLLIPFAGLLSRHVKRNLTFLGFWCGWMLVMHWVDLYWLIMPGMLHGGIALLPLAEVAATVAVLGVAGASFLKILTSERLLPVADPRLGESMAFHNI